MGEELLIEPVLLVLFADTIHEALPMTSLANREIWHLSALFVFRPSTLALELRVVETAYDEASHRDKENLPGHPA